MSTLATEASAELFRQVSTKRERGSNDGTVVHNANLILRCCIKIEDLKAQIFREGHASSCAAGILDGIGTYFSQVAYAACMYVDSRQFTGGKFTDLFKKIRPRAKFSGDETSVGTVRWQDVLSSLKLQQNSVLQSAQNLLPQLMLGTTTCPFFMLSDVNNAISSFEDVAFPSAYLISHIVKDQVQTVVESVKIAGIDDQVVQRMCGVCSSLTKIASVDMKKIGIDHERVENLDACEDLLKELTDMAAELESGELAATGGLDAKALKESLNRIQTNVRVLTVEIFKMRCHLIEKEYSSKVKHLTVQGTNAIICDAEGHMQLDLDSHLQSVTGRTLAKH